MSLTVPTDEKACRSQNSCEQLKLPLQQIVKIFGELFVPSVLPYFGRCYPSVILNEKAEFHASA